MSFWQIFDRINRIARSSSIDLFGERQRFDDELRRAQELIDGERRREEEERRRQSSGADGSGASPGDTETLTLHRASAIIGVSVTASLREITTAYRRRIAEVHPDRYATRSEAEQAEAVILTQRLNEAYAVLKRHHAA